MRANFPASMQASTSRPICTRKRGFVYAPWASRMASRYAPRRGKRAAMEMAFFQLPAAAAFLRVCSFVSMLVTLPSSGIDVQTVGRI